MSLAFVSYWAEQDPTRLALVTSGVAFSYDEFAKKILSARDFFVSCGLERGRTAVLCVHDLAQDWILGMALRALGANTIDVRSWETLVDVGATDAAAFVVSQLDPRRPAFSPAPGAHVIEVPASVLLNPQRREASSETSADFQGGHFLYTSGTTGKYKRIFLDGAKERLRAQRQCDLLGFRKTTVHNSIDFGLWTAVGFKRSAAVWLVGGAVVLDQRPQRHAEFFRHNVNAATLTPTLIDAVADAHAELFGPSNRVRLAVGGGFISKRHVQVLSDRFTRDVRIWYSSTEVEGILELDMRHNRDVDWLTSVPGRTVEVVNASGARARPGETGELRVRLIDTDASEYLDDAETSARFFRNECFYTGDLAIKRADGRIRVLGRYEDVLNIDGDKVAVAPIEADLQLQLKVKAVCIFSNVGAQGTELVIALEAAERPSEEDQRRIARTFASFKRVRFEVLAQFPRSEGGFQKIQRAKLREMVV